VSKRLFKGTKKVKEVKLRRKNGEKYSRRRVLEVSIEISGQDSFKRKTNDSRLSDMVKL